MAKDDSFRDCCVSERLDQAVFDFGEAQPSGKSYLPIVGVPGFPGSILGPSASTSVHDCLSLILVVGEDVVRRRMPSRATLPIQTLGNRR